MPRPAEEKLLAVERIVNGRGFTTIRESLNAVEAWLGSLPGHVYANVRQPHRPHPQSRPPDAAVGGVGRAGDATRICDGAAADAGARRAARRRSGFDLTSATSATC